MKTPHTIELQRVYGERKYNPITDEYTEPFIESEVVPCLANYVSQQKVFELYGDRVNRVLVARFNQPQEPFNKAIYDSRTFVPIETIDAPVKGAVRLKEVQDGL